MRYPLFLELAGRRVVVVGGGSLALRRIPALIDAGAEVTVVAPEYDAGLAELDVRIELRDFAPADLDGAWLAFACTDVASVNATVSAAAERRGIWCVRGDDAERSKAWRPAAVQVDDVTVAVSAGGDPSRAVAVRNAIEAELRGGGLSGRRGRSSGGRVILIGGGPGDPDLLTLRGYRALLDADVVVTDRLGPTGLLEMLPAEIEVIDVGKPPSGGHAAEQDAINALLIERAKRGQVVVRLKGGDPFVFGRGSEEVDACAAAGVMTEVVPGLTSSVAAATIAGIPLTERGTSQHFTVVSGHVPPGDERSSVDWGLVAASDGTLVLLMAVANLRPITEALISGGRKPGTPVAVIESASLPNQRVITATLGDLPDVAASEQVVPPAVVVIGDVVRLG